MCLYNRLHSKEKKTKKCYCRVLMNFQSGIKPFSLSLNEGAAYSTVVTLLFRRTLPFISYDGNANFFFLFYFP